MATKAMGIKNKASLLSGIILLVIGLVASFYKETYRIGRYSYDTVTVTPYQNAGIALIVSGILFLALGLFYSPRQPSPPPPKQST